MPPRPSRSGATTKVCNDPGHMQDSLGVTRKDDLMAMIRTLIFSLLLANPLRAGETYDLIFRQGTLTDLPITRVLEYDRQVEVHSNLEYGARHTGSVQLNFEPDDMARLRFRKDGKHQNLGTFPATVGNPIIMYFVETVLRDVAHEAGGSPFYIRNRIKEALVTKVPIKDVTVRIGGSDVAAKQITLRPFETDKNRDRMGVYGDLALTFTMSDEVPGWYSSLVASAPGKDGAVGYTNALTLMPDGAGK